MARPKKPRDLFKVRIVRTLTGEVVETWDREFRTESAARKDMERWPAASHVFGDLHSNPLHHQVQIVCWPAEEPDPASEPEVIARYILMERRTMSVLVIRKEDPLNPRRDAWTKPLDGTWHVIERTMVWVKTIDEHAREFAELTADIPDRGPILWGDPTLPPVTIPDGTITLHRGSIEPETPGFPPIGVTCVESACKSPGACAEAERCCARFPNDDEHSNADDNPLSGDPDDNAEAPS